MKHPRTMRYWLAATLAVCSAPALAADYTFEALAISGGTIDPFGFGTPVLNNAGIAAFGVGRVGGRHAVVRAGIGGWTVIADDRVRFARFGGVSVNDAGQVGFEASFERVTGEGILRGDGSVARTIAGTRDAGDFDFVNAGPQINGRGRLAFIGERKVGSAFVDGVYVGAGGPVRAVYDTTGAFSDFNGNPALNDAGTVAFLAQRRNGTSGLYLGNGGAGFVTVADDTGRLVGSLDYSDPALNDRGEVAFRAGTNEDPADNASATGSGIFVFRAGALTTVVEGGFADIFSLGEPALNNLGQLAFVLEPSFGEQLLLTGADRVDDRVVGSGDTLLGRTVSGIVFGREGLNDKGQLAFTAFFDDGSAAVVLASPVPELPAGWMMGAGMIGLCWRRRARAGCRRAPVTLQVIRRAVGANALPCSKGVFNTHALERFRPESCAGATRRPAVSPTRRPVPHHPGFRECGPR